MPNDLFSLDAYMARIGYAGPLEPDASLLEGMQRGQLAAIPFENFDILLGRGISLDPAALCDKLLSRRRGGYCFELNAVFLMALEAAGFDARPLLARVHLSGQASARTHELILVTLDSRRWIADAGFGGPSLRAPIPLELDETRVQNGEAFRLVDAGRLGTMLQKRVEAQWRDLYSFDLGHVLPADIALGNHFTSTHPSSHFTFERIATLQTPRGRIALLDRTLRTVEEGAEAVRQLPEGSGFIAELERHFGIELDAPYELIRPLRLTPADTGCVDDGELVRDR